MQRNIAKRLESRSPRLQYGKVPGLLNELQLRPEVAARVLQLIILSACRPTEVMNARWQDIDWRTLRWTIPAANTKSGRTHIVPFVPAMATVLVSLRGLDEECLLPRSWARSWAVLQISALLRRMGYKAIVPRDFRLCFFDWAVDQGRYSQPLICKALGHDASTDPCEPAANTESLRERWHLMQAWSLYCLSESLTGYLDEA